MSDTTARLNSNLNVSSFSIASPVEVEPQEPQQAAPRATSPRTVKGRKIWIDIDNSPHVPFFLPIIDELKKRGFEVELTARDIYQVCQLLDFFKLDCKVIGGHYGKNKIFKVLGNLMRSVATRSHGRRISRGSGAFSRLTRAGPGLQSFWVFRPS